MNASPARCSSATSVQAGHLGGVRDAVPQLEGALEQRGGLAEGVDGLGRRGGADARAQRVALVAGRGVVMGDAGGDLRAVGTVAGAALERGGEGACSSVRSPGRRSSATTSRRSAWRKV